MELQSTRRRGTYTPTRRRTSCIKGINLAIYIYNININDQTYDIILGLKEEIITDIVNNESQGGDNILIKIKTKISFLFDKLDTIGDIIGFKNVGTQSSITPFNSIISNKDSYIYTNN